MVEDLSVWETIRVRYSFPRIQWLIGAMSFVSMLYLSSEEIWNLVDSEPFPEVTAEGIIYYVTFFLVTLMVVHYFDTRKIVQKNSVAIVASLISIAIDLCLLSLSELIVLYAIQVLPQDISKGIVMLLIGAMPASLGTIVLTSLTAETLKKRAKKLFEEAQAISRQTEKLEKQRKMAMESLKSFEKKKREFENYFKKQDKKDEDKKGKDCE